MQGAWKFWQAKKPLLPDSCQMLLGRDRAVQGCFCCGNLGAFLTTLGQQPASEWQVKAISQGIYQVSICPFNDRSHLFLSRFPHSDVILTCISIGFLERKRKGWNGWGMQAGPSGSVFWMGKLIITHVPVGNGVRTSTGRCVLTSSCSAPPCNQHEFWWLHLIQHLARFSLTWGRLEACARHFCCEKEDLCPHTELESQSHTSCSLHTST